MLIKRLGSVWDVNIQEQVETFPPPSPARTCVPAARK